MNGMDGNEYCVLCIVSKVKFLFCFISHSEGHQDRKGRIENKEDKLVSQRVRIYMSLIT